MNESTSHPAKSAVPREQPPSSGENTPPLDLSAMSVDEICMEKSHRIMSRIYAHHAVGRAVLEDQALFSQLVPLLEKRLALLEAASKAAEHYRETAAELEYLEKCFPEDPRLGHAPGGSGPV